MFDRILIEAAEAAVNLDKAAENEETGSELR